MNLVPADSGDLSRGNILVVDDTPANLSLLAQMLKGLGYKVRVAPSGKLALASVQAAPPDLILLDINMPEMNGYELCQQIKADKRTSDIPVIFVSAMDDGMDKVRAFTVGGADYIAKPFEPLEVLARIQHQLRLRETQIKLQAHNTQLRLLLSATQAINAASDLESALIAMLETVCKTIGWEYGQAVIPSPDGTEMVWIQGWYAVDDRFKKFRESNSDLIFTPNLGLVGRVWISQQPEWIEDLGEVSGDRFIAAQSAFQVGLRTALGVPIVCDGMVVAILVFLRCQQTPFQPETVELVNAVATQVGFMIQRKKAEAALWEANRQLERLASLDGLTQVANRRRFDEFLAQEWRRSLRDQQPLALILCDVDYFKPYNDYYGHQEGDACLQRIAQAMEQSVRRPADLVARYGGEEFAVVLPNTDSEGAITVAKSIQQTIQMLQLPHARSQVSPYITLSLGISSLVPQPENSIGRLISLADEALYEAKQRGRDRIVVNSPALFQVLGIE